MRSSLIGRVVVGIALITGLTLAGLTPVATAAVEAPGDLSPADLEVSGQPLLAWDRVAGAEEYEVQVALTDSFTSFLVNTKTDNSRYAPTEQMPFGTELYWRVRGIDGTGKAGDWSFATFTITTSAGPQPLAPADEADLQQPVDPTLLSWDVVPGAVSYSIEVDTDDMFIGAAAYTSKVTSYLVPDPGLELTYFWRVRANFDDGYASEWSEPMSFNVLALPAPDLVSPDDSSTTQVQDAVLDWAPVAGAVKYEVRVSTENQFNNNVESVTVKSTRYARPRTYDNDQYWWQVRAVDANGNKSPWSTSLNQFQRNWPQQPTLIAPAEGEVMPREMFFEWSPVEHASSYRIEVAPDPSFSPNTFDWCETTGTTFAVGRVTTSCTPQVSGTYYWRVRAMDKPANVNGIFSEIGSFSYDPGIVDFHSGVDGDVPTLSWEDYPGAEKYKLVLRKASGTQVNSVTTYGLSWTPTGTEKLKPEDGPYRWSVQAEGKDHFVSNVPLVSGQDSFAVTNVDQDDPLVDALTPDVVDPTYRMPSLTWEPFVGAAYYRLYIGAGGVGGGYTQIGDRYPYAAATVSSADYLAAGTYSWFVEAYDDDNHLVGGPGLPGTFTIMDLEPVDGTSVSLTGSGLGDEGSRCDVDLSGIDDPDKCAGLQQTPSFAWDRVPEAAYYMVYLYKDPSLTTLADGSLGPTAVQMNTANTYFNLVKQLPDNTAGTGYYWAIRPCKTAGRCNPDPTVATDAFEKRSNPVTGLEEREHDSEDVLPPNGPGGSNDSPEFADEVVLSWDPYLTTNQAGNEVDVTGLGATIDAATYNVQIGPDPTFASNSTLRVTSLDQTTFTPYTETLPEGPLYWRVQAVDGSGNELAWSLNRNVASATQAIEKVSPTPELTFPSDNAKVTGTPALRWDALNYANEYEIQVAKNGDDKFSVANRVIASSSEQATYVPTKTLDPAGSPYVWRVRRMDVDNRPGAWSTLGHFEVKAETPGLLAPISDAKVDSRDALFTWDAVAGAAKYRFERRAAGTSSVRESATTVGLSWAPRTWIADGNWEWRVTAYDGGSIVLGSSGWRDFIVDDTGPRVISKTPLSQGKPKSNVVVIFDEEVKALTSKTMSIFQKGKKGKLSAKVTLTGGGTRAVLNPAKNLKRGSSYTIKVAGSITDEWGNKLTPLSWTILVL